MKAEGYEAPSEKHASNKKEIEPTFHVVMGIHVRSKPAGSKEQMKNKNQRERPRDR